MLGLLKYPDDFSRAQGLNQLWYKILRLLQLKLIIMGLLQDILMSYNYQQPRKRFFYIIPLTHINAVCKDYDKIVYCLIHRLTLFGQSDDNAIFRAATADAG